MSHVDISIVIGFRDWGAERLRLCVSSLLSAAHVFSTEIIVSDYGSEDPSVSRGIAVDLGVRWVSTPGDPLWSRSRALDAGFSVANGDLLISTDADMLFAPGSLDAIRAEVRAAAPAAGFLQCRDLPESVTPESLEDPDSVDWDRLEAVSTLRPRWGMGGMMAIDREGFEVLRGFDERLHTYGREDMDLALRARRAGRRTVWLQDPRARMFHIWHPSTSTTVSAEDSGRHAVARNRRIVDSDLTTTRNLLRPSAPLPQARPLVSVVVEDASGAGLEATVATALAQSVRDTEVLLCGSPLPGTEDPRDDRVRRLPAISEDPVAGLREAVEHARGLYVAVVRCGDVLPLERTEQMLRGLAEAGSAVLGRSAGEDPTGTLRLGPPEDHDSLLLVRRDAAHAALADGPDHPLPTGDTLTALLRACGFDIAPLPFPVLLPAEGLPSGDGALESVAPELGPSLRALLPRSVDAPGRDVTVSLSGDSAASLPDEVASSEFLTIEKGSELLVGMAVLRDATFTQLAALASAGAAVEVMPSGTALDSGAVNWLETVIRHARSSGARDALLLSVAGGEGTGDVYTVRAPTVALSVSVEEHATPSAASGSSGTRPWIAVGARAEEVWG